MKEKDFMALDVQKQKEYLNELIEKWYGQDSENRCAIVILGDKNAGHKRDAGKSLFSFSGPGNLIMNSLKTALDSSENFKNIVSYLLYGPLAKIITKINLNNKEEE